MTSELGHDKLVRIIEEGEASSVFDDAGIDNVFTRKRIVAVLSKAQNERLEIDKLKFAAGGIVRAEVISGGKRFITDLGKL